MSARDRPRRVRRRAIPRPTTNLEPLDADQFVSPEFSSRARALALPYYEDALPAHDEFHANRVRDLALRLAADVDSPIDEELLAAAAWLHDIGRPLERTGEIDDHGRWAAREVGELLGTENVTTERLTAVQHCLRTHSIRSSSPDPERIEAKLLFDADKLDAIGAVGIVRLAAIVGERSERSGGRYAVIDDATAVRKATADQRDASLLREWASERLTALHTEPAQRLGASRWEYVVDFFERFRGEIGPDATR
ncbi:HD domain-containing protein [Halomicroarcula salina]|uniref:HD domain-containing protein n=1 Tax=Haloarcula salina TaxID=1429914 RepID=A0AA41G1J9_9EURY|nr:HD domain-containing protein [Haloarcula salina]